MPRHLVSRQQPRGDAIQERTQESMTKAVAESKANNAMGLKRLTNADAEGEMHLLQIKRANARCTWAQVPSALSQFFTLASCKEGKADGEKPCV